MYKTFKITDDIIGFSGYVDSDVESFTNAVKELKTNEDKKYGYFHGKGIEHVDKSFSHKVKEITVEDGVVYGAIEPMDNQQGKMLKDMLKNNLLQYLEVVPSCVISENGNVDEILSFNVIMS